MSYLPSPPEQPLVERASAPLSLPLTRRMFTVCALLGAPAATLTAAPALAAGPDHSPGGDEETSPPSGEDPNLDQTVTDTEEHVSGEPAVIDAGHVDLGPRLRDGEWTFHARDDSQVPPVWRDLEDVVLFVRDAGAMKLPDSEDYAFTTAQPGDRIWTIPQVEIPGVVWLGWNTQDPEVVRTATRGVRLRFHSVQGPGAMSLFLQPGTFDPPQVLVDPAVTEPQDVFVEPNTHTHVNWVFTEPGTYLVDVEALAELPDGTVLTDSRTLRVAVGEQSDPTAALEATWDEGAGPEARRAEADSAASDGGGTSPDDGPTADDAASDAEEAPPRGLLIGGVGAAAAVAAGGTALVMQRRRRQRLEADVWDDQPGREQ